MPNKNEDSVSRLYRVILQLDSEDDCRRFFEDLCTIREISDMAQRLDAAFLLDKKCSYQQISKDVSISTATIGRVSKCLNYGAGGYRLALDRWYSEQKEG
jgi:TrpR-related protein YerC/YecD